MRLSFTSGSLSGGLGLFGTGAVILWPTSQWLGYLLIASGVVVFLFDVRFESGHLAIGKGKKLKDRIASLFGRGRAPVRNTYLADAVHYAFDGIWPGEELPSISTEKLEATGRIYPALMQAAIDGNLTIWGKGTDQTALYQKLSPDYWHDYGLDDFSFFHGREEMQSEPKRTHGLPPAPGIMRALKTNKKQWEKAWARQS